MTDLEAAREEVLEMLDGGLSDPKRVAQVRAQTVPVVDALITLAQADAESQYDSDAAVESAYEWGRTWERLYHEAMDSKDDVEARLAALRADLLMLFGANPRVSYLDCSERDFINGAFVRLRDFANVSPPALATPPAEEVAP